MFPKYIKDHPIWSKVAAGLITAGILGGAALIPGLYRAAWNFIKYIGAWLITSTPTPHWLLILLSFGAVIVIVQVAVYLFTNSDTSIAWYQYTQDEFWRVVWRWKYSENGIVPVGAFCPNCDMQMIPVRDYDMRRNPRIAGSHFTCDHCGQFDTMVPIGGEDIQNSVILEIQRKIRTGEWRETVVNLQKQIRT